MADFVSEIWGVYVALITVVSIIACGVLLKALSTQRAARGEQVATTGHKWDEDLEEWNNPLPRWWMWLFYITIVFGLLYLIFYPGLGSYQGAFKWSSLSEYRAEQAQAGEASARTTGKYAKLDVKAVAADPEARRAGQRLFLSYCSQCHGSDAGGGRGFPNLRDSDWLYGGEPEDIKTSITDGRNGVMPALGAVIGGEEGAKDVAHYVLSLAGRTHDGLRAFNGKSKFATVCAACHGPEGKGNKTIGAPNLSDEVWLHGGTEAWIMETIIKGRGTPGASAMPRHGQLLDEAKIHLLTAYVWSLSHEK